MLRFLFLNFVLVLCCISTALWCWSLFRKYTIGEELEINKGNVVFTSFVISLLTAFMFTMTYVKEAFYTVNIYSLQSSSPLAGPFYLGSGNFESRDQYFTYVKHEDGLMRYSFPANGVTIVQYNGTPKMIMSHGVYADNMLSRFYGMANKNSSMLPIYPVKIYVPKNTVIQKFSVN